MTSGYDAILFDFDGVLVDSEPIHWACWREVVAPYGLALTWEDYARECIGVSDRKMIEALCRIAGRDSLFDPVWAEYPRKKALFRDRMLLAVPMPTATRELLLQMAGPPLAVVSSSGRLEVEPALEAAGVRAAFATIVTGDDVRRLKPDPEPYLIAAARLGARRPLVVEDSDAGARAGSAAGFDVLRIADPERTAESVLARLGPSSWTPAG